MLSRDESADILIKKKGAIDADMDHNVVMFSHLSLARRYESLGYFQGYKVGGIF